jgi:hypothetical protein
MTMTMAHLLGTVALLIIAAASAFAQKDPSNRTLPSLSMDTHVLLYLDPTQKYFAQDLSPLLLTIDSIALLFDSPLRRAHGNDAAALLRPARSSLGLLLVLAALRFYFTPSFQPVSRVSALATSRFDSYFFQAPASNSPDSTCSSLAIQVVPQSGDPDLRVSDRPFSSGACSSVAGTLCLSSTVTGADTVTLALSQATSTGFFYVIVNGYSATSYTLTFNWRGASGVCGTEI